jgi:Ca-activated chloride channel family protein
MLLDVRTTLQKRRTATAILRLSCIALIPGSFLAPHACLPSLPWTWQPQGVTADKRIIKVDVALVTVPVVVTDSKGNYVPGLKKTDFRIFENDLAQGIDRLIPTMEPFHVALMLDRSGSTTFRYEDIQSAALAFVDALRPQDRFLIVSFDTTVTYHAEFTNERPRLRAAILQTNSSGSRTRLYDAIQTVMTERLDPLPGRKVMVLFTDGVDNDSERMDAGSALALIEKSDVLGYAIQYDTRNEGLPDRFPLPASQRPVSFDTLYKRAGKYLRDLSSRSGGRIFQAETLQSLREAFSQIAEELPQQYTLCYYPSQQARAGSFRRIRVTVNKPGVKVRARSGYRAGTQMTPGK